jgi:hypothetical protein
MQNAKLGSMTFSMPDELLELTRFPPLHTSQHFAFFNSHFAFCIHHHDQQRSSRARAPAAHSTR